MPEETLDRRKAMRVISWLSEGGQNLRSLRSLYNGISGLMSHNVVWTRESMAEVAWLMHLFAEKCQGMGDRAERVSRIVGEHCGYKISKEGKVYRTLGDAEGAVMAEEENTIDWSKVTDLEIEMAEERVDRR